MENEFIENEFDPEMMDKIVRQAIQGTFDVNETTRELDQKSIDKWTKCITDYVLKNCSQDNCNCKYAVTTVFMQKVGAGFAAQNKMHWDTNNVEDGGDGFVKVAWENEDLFVLVTVYAVKVLAYFSQEQVRALKAMDYDAGL